MQWLSTQRLLFLDYSVQTWFSIQGALYQKRAGTARHDAVAWGFAWGAIETTKGNIRAKKVGIAVAGYTGYLLQKAGLWLPIETHLLQAFVSEPLKPMLDVVIGYGAAHFYISQ